MSGKNRLLLSLLAVVFIFLFLSPSIIEVAHADTFGRTNTGDMTCDTFTNYKDASRFQFTGTTGSDLTSISIYFVSTAAASVKVALYADSSGSPSTLLASNTTGVAKGTGAKWVTVNCAYGDLTNNAYYWFAVKSSGSGTISYGASSAVSNYRYISETYSSAFANPFGSTESDALEICIYGTYTAGGGTPYTAACTLGVTASISDATQWSANTAQTLGFATALTGSLASVFNVATSLGFTSAISGAVQTVFNVAESLGFTSSISDSVVSVFNNAESLGITAALSGAVVSVFNVAASLSIGLGLVVDAALSGITEFLADCSLAFSWSLDGSTQWTASVPAALSILATISGTVGSAFTVSLENGFSAAINVLSEQYTPVLHVADLTLGIVLALVVGAVLSSGITLEGFNFILAIIGITLAVVALVGYTSKR